MKRLLSSLLFLLISAHSLFSVNAQYTTVTGIFVDGQGNLLSGKLVMSIPYAGLTTLEGSVVSPQNVTFNLYNGSITGPNQLIPNGDILPVNSYYVASLYDYTGYLVETTNVVVPLGSSFNLGLALQTTVTTANISYINPANLTGSNTWTGINTYNSTSNFAGPVFFTSTVSGLPIGIPRASLCPSNADTILSTDRFGYVSWSDASACTVSLPQAGTTGYTLNFTFLGCNIGAGLVTITPAISTISYSVGNAYISGASSVPVTVGQCISVYSNNVNYFAILSGGGITAPNSATPQVGDTLRYNVNGDGAFDTVNMAQSVEGIYAINQTAAFSVQGGPFANGNVTPLGGSTDIPPTATSQYGKLVTAAATASTNTVIAMHYGENGSVSLMGMEAFYRWSFKAAMGNTTNVRYWFGLGCVHTAGTGNNGLAINGTTAYATDTPNKSTIGFRYSAGTDTHWQAVTDTAGGSQTTTDTGVTPDTNIHLFEMTTNSTGTTIFYFIDSVLVATISTNLPPPANTFDSWGDRFFTGDNKNTATAISLAFYSMQTSFK